MRSLTSGFSLILCKLMSLGQYCRNRPPSFSLALCCQGECGLQKEVHEVCPLQPLDRPLSRVSVCRRAGGSSRKHGRTARPRRRLSCFGSWPAAESDFCAPCNWAEPPGLHSADQIASSPQSGSCRQQAVAAGLCQCARQTGGCPGRNCLAACGVGGRGADGGQSMYGFGQDTWQFFGNSSRSPRPALSLSPVLPLTGRCIGNGNLPTLTPSPPTQPTNLLALRNQCVLSLDAYPA